ncbi:RNase H domain-containing protein [Trichonephila clavipes]|nr:RNase H domain-containing protein [Trichonephila clavipes]
MDHFLLHRLTDEGQGYLFSPVTTGDWIPSHIDLEGNEIVGTLAKAGACEVPEPSAPLTFVEIFSRTKHQNKTAWITPLPQSTIGISVLVLEVLWFTVLQDMIKLLQPDFKVAVSKQCNSPKDERALKCAQTVLLSRPRLLTSSSALGSSSRT